MTICIAAVCEHNEIPRIILCADWKGQSSFGSAEVTEKFYMLKQGWFALGAGTKSHIDLLVREYRRHLATIDEITDVNIAEVMRVPLRKRKRDLAEEYIQGRFAMTYDDFLATGKDKLPTDVYREELDAVRRIDLGARLIIAGFTFIGFADKRREQKHASPNICVTDYDASIQLMEHWAAIGEGAYVSTPQLFIRACESMTDMTEALYYVYEAKTASENVSSVGEETSIEVLNPTGRLVSLSGTGWNRFDRLYKKLHPKPQRKNFIFHVADFELSDYDAENLEITG